MIVLTRILSFILRQLCQDLSQSLYITIKIHIIYTIHVYISYIIHTCFVATKMNAGANFHFTTIWNWFNLGFTSVRKKTEFFDKSSKTIDILPVFFEPKWRPNYCTSDLVHYTTTTTFHSPQGSSWAKRSESWRRRWKGADPNGQVESCGPGRLGAHG